MKPKHPINSADLLCLSSEVLLCKIKASKLERDLVVLLESVDALVKRLDEAHARINEQRKAMFPG